MLMQPEYNMFQIIKLLYLMNYLLMTATIKEMTKQWLKNVRKKKVIKELHINSMIRNWQRWKEKKNI